MSRVRLAVSRTLISHQFALNRSRMTSLSPKSVLITGANRGLGLEFVKQFLQLPQPPKYMFAGCREPEQANALQGVATEHPSVRIVKVDVQDDVSISAAATEVETVVGDAGLNLLLNNAGISNQERGIDLLTRGKLNEHFDVNVSAHLPKATVLMRLSTEVSFTPLPQLATKTWTGRLFKNFLKQQGPMMVTKAFLPLLQKAAAKGDPDTYNCNRATVVNFSTILSLIGCIEKRKDLRYPYCSTKCALNMATSILANEMSADGILAVSLHPGWVKTDMGGPKAPLEIPDAISQCMKTLSSLDKSSSGRLITYAGAYKSWSDTE